jgi:hypothetical protein
MSVTLVADIFFILKRQILVYYFILSASIGSAQLFDQVKESFNQKPSVYFNYGSQYSFISDNFANIKNIRIGLDYANVSRFGIGYNWLSDKFPVRSRFYEGSVREAKLNMHYLSIFAEYTFYRTYHWEASIPAQAGMGLAWYSYTDNVNQKKNAERKFFVLYEPVMTIQYRFLKYFAAGGGIGYRLILINSSAIGESFISPLLVIKTKLYFGEIWKDLRKKK